ncbi:hypothetical protein [Micromonospora marina]|uniref:hypothetical protein n=1 Tax=Micromonospora marina TaxID=307120 RepID=UPI003455653B
MAEDDIARTGIRVGGWLPTPDEPADAPERPAGPRRLPGNPDPAVPGNSDPARPWNSDPARAGNRDPAGPGNMDPAVPWTMALPEGDRPPAEPDDPVSVGNLEPPGTAVWPPPPRTSGPPAPDRPAAGPPSAGPSSSRPGAADEPADSGLPHDPAARPGRHSARESLPARLADLTGGLASKTGARLRALAHAAKSRLGRTLAPIAGPMRPSPDAPATRVAAARARRRRRRVVLAAVAVTGLVAALAYTARSSVPLPLTRETAPVAAPGKEAPSEQAPGEQAPSEQAPSEQPPSEHAPSEQAPGEQAPGEQPPSEQAPGGPLLDVDLAPLPGTSSLTALGTRDWRHWGGDGADSFHRKASGTGEIQDPGGERLEHNAGAGDLQWTDGTPTARQEGTRAGVFQRGAGKSFTLGVAGSGDARTVRLFVGTFSAGARLDLSLSSGGDPVVREVALAAGDRFYQYVVRFRAAPGERLLIRWQALTVTGGQNDGVALQAITVS